jgi:hypothetical protein
VVAVLVDQVQHAIADALHHRRVDGLGLGLVRDRFAAVAEHRLADFVGRLREADREAAGARAVRRAKSAAKESGSSLTRKLTPPWRYTVIGRVLCCSTAVKPMRRK